VGSEKRERQKENRRARLEAEAEAYRRKQRNRRILLVVVAAAVIGLVALLVNVFGDEDEAPVATSDSTTTTAAPGTPPSPPPAGASVTGETECPPADGSAERTTSFENPPPMCLEDGVQYDAVVTTDAGTFTIALDREAAPETVNNFVVLSRYHFYDGVPFHRVIQGFMIQTGNGGGDTPGYAITDELPDSVDDYVEGSVAMANAGPNTAGSQWFVWLGPQELPTPDYALFGQVTEGLDVVRAIEADGAPSDPGIPTTAHVIQSVEIVERDADAPTTTAAGDSTTTTPPTTAGPTTTLPSTTAAPTSTDAP
jgi:peptidylprolyl isomerase